MCGTLAFEESNFLRRPGIIPRVCVSPSSEDSYRSCMPRQIPRTGFLVCFSQISRSRERKSSMAAPAWPTPGKMIPSAFSSSLGSSEIINSAPSLSSALVTEARLPALYFMMPIMVLICSKNLMIQGYSYRKKLQNEDLCVIKSFLWLLGGFPLFVQFGKLKSAVL